MLNFIVIKFSVYHKILHWLQLPQIYQQRGLQPKFCRYVVGDHIQCYWWRMGKVKWLTLFSTISPSTIIILLHCTSLCSCHDNNYFTIIITKRIYSGVGCHEVELHTHRNPSTAFLMVSYGLSSIAPLLSPSECASKPIWPLVNSKNNNY